MSCRRGVLIAVEGVDASGLTTHSRLIVDALQAKGYKSVYTKEPTEGPIGNLIRHFLRSKLEDHKLLALLFAADRVWHYMHDPTLPAGRGIMGALNDGYIVVSDRYKYSSLAYQGSFVDLEWVSILNSKVPEADVIVFIETDLEVNIQRLGMRESLELYEAERKIKLIKLTFQKVLSEAEKNGVHVIRVKGSVDGIERPTPQVSDEILRELKPVIERIVGCRG
jgi:dTMP kinase